MLSYGRGVGDQVTLGATLAAYSVSLHDSGFDLDTSYAVSLWAEYGSEGPGLKAGAAIGMVRGSAEITRGLGVENIVPSTGKADVETVGFRATLGYGIQTQDWLLTPSVTLSHIKTTRDAYDETGIGFNAEYDKLSVSRTSLTLALDARYDLSEQSALLFGLGVEHDLSADQATLTGTSDLPGMLALDVGSPLERRETRGFASIGYQHDMGNGMAFSGVVQAGQSAYGDAVQVSARASLVKNW